MVTELRPGQPGQKQKPLGDEIFERMLEMIYSCQLPPGAVVNESALANQFGVSRGPIREAIRRLQGIQLVSREPYLKARVVMFSAEAVVELFQMREALEGFACRLAAQRMSDQEVAALAAELEKARQAALGAPDNAAARRFDFHERIVRASRNDRIIDALCGDLYHLLRIYRRRSGAVPERKEAAYAEHWQILRAIKNRDPELAESLMRSHIDRAARHLVEHLPNDVRPELRARDGA
jgi:DNA-binding GntR family transcriptional regulator